MNDSSSTRAVHRAIVTCLVLVLFAAACKKKETAAGEATKPVVAAKTATVTVEPFTHYVNAIGSVVGRPGRFAALSAPSPTRVTKIFVAQGARVGLGQPLVEFEQSTFVGAANAAEAAVRATERNYERAQRLANEGILPRKDAETAAADLAKARNDLVTAQRNLALSVLRSPVSGVVTRMTAVLGAPADPAQVLVEVADPSAFDAVLSLGPAAAGPVHPGAGVTLSAGEKAGGEALGRGIVATVGAALDTGSRSVPIRVTVANPPRALRLGESVFGEIAVETRPNATVIPAEALVPGEQPGEYKVFVVDQTGTAHARDVKIGGRTESKVEIVDGLKGGETIVTQGAYGLEDSAKVARPVPVKP